VTGTFCAAGQRVKTRVFRDCRFHETGVSLVVRLVEKLPGGACGPAAGNPPQRHPCGGAPASAVFAGTGNAPDRLLRTWRFPERLTALFEGTGLLDGEFNREK
jgi:hypothetical protein